VADADDGHFVVIKGRRWRATDPAIPEARAAELRRCLMAWRRKAVGAPGSTHPQVQVVKEALGERGTPWWELSLAERRRRWEQPVPWPDE
jgi:hypothetical protein